ncbi:prominin-1-A, partial [Elysia marginata]
ATGIFANRMRHVFQQGAQGLHQAVASEIGVCKPLSNVYDDLLRQSTCSYIVGSLNAWACAMGMTSVFLLLTLCMTCRLSKHLYRMTIDRGEDINQSFPGSNEAVEPSAPPPYHV